MDGSAVQAIQSMALENSIVEKNGEVFARGNYRKVVPPIYRPQVVKLNTLKSLVEFVTLNPNHFDLIGAIVVIGQDLAVRLYSDLHPQDNERTLFAEVSNVLTPFEFDKFISSEAFNIYLQTRFIYDENAMALFATASNLVIEEGVTLSDDGMSQKVTVKRGVSAASAASVSMPTRVTLRPYRIFAEAEQPASDFIVRMTEGQNKSALVGLWETDGGMWRVKAKDSIMRCLTGYGMGLPMFA